MYNFLAKSNASQKDIKLPKAPTLFPRSIMEKGLPFHLSEIQFYIFLRRVG